MKKIISSLFGAAMLVAASFQVHAQGTLVYDQQSATGPVSVVGNGNADGLYIQPEPLTQSFIPTLSAIGFVQFEFEDVLGNGNNGATVYVNLWTGSPIPNTPLAILLGSTAPIYMPDGFENGPYSTGVANFYFPTSITLTPNQIYYLQPVVLSGDNPWAIVAIGDTYPNGQIFDEGAGFRSDFWFREGVVVPVPEPSALALFGLSSLLIFGFKRRFKLVVPLLFAVSILFVHAAGDSVVRATADAASLAPVASTALPRTGTFWIMTTSPSGQLTALPYPVLPSDLSALPAYSVAGNTYILDDTGGQLLPSSAKRMNNVQAAAIAQMQAETMAGLIGQILFPTNSGGGFQYNSYNFSIDTNGLYLEKLNLDATNLWLRLHNTVGGDNYQLLSTANLLNTNWDLGQILLYAADGQADSKSLC